MTLNFAQLNSVKAEEKMQRKIKKTLEEKCSKKKEKKRKKHKRKKGGLAALRKHKILFLGRRKSNKIRTPI